MQLTQSKYLAYQKAILNRVIKLYAPKVYKALQSQIKSFTADLKAHGEAYAKTQLHRHHFNDKIGPVVMGIYKTAGIASANRTYGHLNKQLGVNPKGALIEYEVKYKTFGYNEVWTDEITAYFRKYLLNKVVEPISQTTINFIEKTLDEAVTNGWGVDRIIREMEDSDITKNRTRMIVRTETVRATNFGSMAAANESPYEVLKTWIDVEDNRTRRTHRHASGVGGEKKELLEPYSNGLMFPGDPDGPAAETINCRCTQGFVPKRDIDGRLIKKTQIVPGARQTLADVLAAKIVQTFSSN